MTQGFVTETDFAGFDDPKSGRSIPRWLWAFLAVLMIAGIAALATAAGPKFSFEKNFCVGDPRSLSKPDDCTLATTVPMNTPVYYTFTVTNPWSQPQQVVDIIDPQLSNPSSFGFTPTGPLFCKDDLGAAVIPFTSTAAGGIAKINLGVDRTVTCYAPGIFTSAGTKKNKAEGDSGTHNVKDDVTTKVLGTTPINADLSVTKTAMPNAIDLTTGNDIITYTITVKNNGPADVDVGDWFVLHDRFSLLPNSVPLNVEFVSANCSVTPASGSGSTPNDCLDPNDINLTGGTPTLVGTMGYHNFFDWKYPTNSNGHLQAGSTMTLTIEVRILQLGGLQCIKVKDANGLRNETFFTLANATSAKTELNPANNTAAVNASVETGQTDVDPNCGTGHLKMTKEQVDPSNPVPWGSKVTYKIVIENSSIPAQQITIAKNDLQDWVVEGVNTPPFTRIHVDTRCEPLETTDPNDCAPFTPGIAADPDHNYTFYGETNHAWDTTEQIEIDPGEKITFYTTFVYDKPDCETVPNANPKPIINIARVTYKASPYGAIKVTGQNTTFTQQAKAITEMEPQPACKFLVTKRLKNNPAVVEFGQPLLYSVTFTNLGGARTIGTVMDVARISIPDYATALPFTSTWKCSASWSGGPVVNGVINGTAVHTSSPAQGSPTINLGSNIAFPSGGTIKCTISIVVQRPPLKDKYCTTKPALFENLALMDVTHPFNSNIAWPPSGNYTLGAGSNPKPQDKNWATVEAALPKCWDADINKSATVGGLPGSSSPWTYFGNTNPITYTITTTNTAQSALTGPATPGFVVKDGFAAPYSNTQVTSGTCASSWCWTAPVPHNPRWQIGIKNLAPNADGVWNLTLPGSAVIQGQDINNQACVEAQGAEAGPGWYNNSGINPKCTDYSIPVIPVTTISVRKQVIDQTGAGVTALGPFTLAVSCTPYGIPTASPTTSLHTTNLTGYSNYFTVNTVPMSGTCKVAETALPPIPAAMAQRCGGVGNVAVTSNAPITLGALSATGNPVTVTNTYTCKKPPYLTVTKRINNPGSVVLTNLNFSVSANCTPGGNATQTVNNGSGSGSVTFPVQVGATCTVTENAPFPAFPAAAKTFCGPGKIPAWKTPVLTPNNGTVTIGANGAQVTIINAWECVPATGRLEIIKEVTNTVPGLAIPPQTYPMTASCVPASGGPAIITNLSLTGWPGASGLVNNIPLGSICTVTEQTPSIPTVLASTCANQGKTFQWDPPVYVPNSGSTTIVAGVNVIRVKNTWSCVGNNGTLSVIKTVNTPQGALQFPQKSWVINTNCTPAGSASTVTLTTAATGNASVSSLPGSITAPIGADCTVSETQPAPPMLPSWATSFCAIPANGGGTPSWDVPTYTVNGQTTTTPPVVDITAGNQTVTVTNAWSCKPANGQVQIFKKVFGPTQQIPAMPFVINSNCTTPSTPASVTITTSNQGGGGAVSAPVGTGCQFTETLPATFSVAQTAYCSGQNGAVPQWAAPSYSIAQPMTVTASLQNLFITNDWSCVQPTAPGTIKVYKLVYGPTIPGLFVPQMTQQTYSFASNCASPSTPASVSVTTVANGISSQPFVAPVGTTCTISETLPSAWPQTIIDFCAARTPSGQQPTWEAPTYSIAQPMTATTAAQTVTVTNRWKCAPPPSAKKKKPKFKINIGIGIPGIGGGGDKPRDPPRDIPNGP